MRKLAMKAAVLAAAAALAGTAQAATADGKFAVEDSGRATCAAFTKARAAKSPDYHLLIGFIQGYITAANRYEPDTFDLTPWQTADAFALILAKHCEQTPKDNLVAVAQKMVVTMKPTRLVKFSEIVLVGEANHRRPVYQEVMTQAQSALLKKGLYRGPIDGKYSPPMKAAIVEFQKSTKLRPTGMPDTATLWLLLNP